MRPTQQRTEEGEKICPECARTFHNEFRMDPNDSAPFVMRNLPSPDDYPAHIQLTKRKFIEFRNSHAELGEFAAMVCGVDLKTFCLLDMLKFIHKRGAKVTALELELERAKDLLAGMADTKRQDDHAFWNLEAELERSKEEVKRLRDALEKIANIDHRGNRHHSQWIAFEALSVPPKVRDLGEGQ